MRARFARFSAVLESAMELFKGAIFLVLFLLAALILRMSFVAAIVTVSMREGINVWSFGRLGWLGSGGRLL